MAETVPGTDLGDPLRVLGRTGDGTQMLGDPSFELGECLVPVLPPGPAAVRLRFETGRTMTDPHTGFGLVAVLTSRPRSPVGLDVDISEVERLIILFFTGEDRDRDRRGVSPGVIHGHSLDSVHPSQIGQAVSVSVER